MKNLPSYPTNMDSKPKPTPAGVDMGDLVTRVIKYVLEGLAVAIAAYVIPGKTMRWNEVAMIALTATATFAILDIYAPSVGSSARTGAGGFPRLSRLQSIRNCRRQGRSQHNRIVILCNRHHIQQKSTHRTCRRREGREKVF